jgi:hypothetical protein
LPPYTASLPAVKGNRGGKAQVLLMVDAPSHPRMRRTGAVGRCARIRPVPPGKARRRLRLRRAAGPAGVPAGRTPRASIALAVPDR